MGRLLLLFFLIKHAAADGKIMHALHILRGTPGFFDTAYYLQLYIIYSGAVFNFCCIITVYTDALINIYEVRLVFFRYIIAQSAV